MSDGSASIATTDSALRDFEKKQTSLDTRRIGRV